ncbi:hypothetical protein FQN54_003802 [Arachnomyces sp. PD_36]|nr:hypothetical protein FQN54_003802 [Arachnomyces sp. PD_36]
MHSTRTIQYLFRNPRSFFNTSRPITTSASTIAQKFLQRFQSPGPQVRTQTLDANQLHLLSLTLNRTSPPHPSSSSTSPPLPGTPIPPGHHLVYFTPSFVESELGADGTDTSYNPDPPFTRRMWAGGEVKWPRSAGGKGPNLLRVGQEVRETTRVLSAEGKVVRRTGEEMVVVGVEKSFENEDGVAVVDRRNWVFREALPMPSSSSSSPSTQSSTPPSPSPSTPPSKTPISTPPANSHVRHLSQSPTTLFRFSALTFNAHKIHYSLPWAREVEGHRGVVVHGPLNLICMLDFWRDIHSSKAPGSELAVPESISYRATSPLYADEEYQIVLEEGEDAGKVNIYSFDGTLAMKADIRGT